MVLNRPDQEVTDTIVLMNNYYKGINYSIDLSNLASWKYHLFPINNSIKEDFLYIRDKLHCNNIRIYGRHIGCLIRSSTIALQLCITPWISPRFIDVDFDTTKKLFREFCMKARDTGLEKQPLFVANELVLDASNILEKTILPWSKRMQIVLDQAKKGKIVDVTENIMSLVEIARNCGWKGSLSYASFMYEVVDWESIKDDNLIVAKNLYWEKDSETDKPEGVEMYEQKVKKLIKEAGGRSAVISEYGAVPHKDGLATGGGGFMLRGEIDYNAQKYSLIRYFEVFKKYHLASFLFCFANKTKYPESSFGIIDRKRPGQLLPAAEIFSKF